MVYLNLLNLGVCLQSDSILLHCATSNADGLKSQSILSTIRTVWSLEELGSLLDA